MNDLQNTASADLVETELFFISSRMNCVYSVFSVTHVQIVALLQRFYRVFSAIFSTVIKLELIV